MLTKEQLDSIENITDRELTERENYLLALYGRKPRWVPIFSQAVNLAMPDHFAALMSGQKTLDEFGVHWVVDATGFPMVDPHTKVLADIEDWKSYTTFLDTDLSSWDWEGMAERYRATSDPNKATMASTFSSSVFITLMNMMGFEGGLCTMAEDPETVHEFFDAATAYMEEVVRYMIRYFKPDIVMFADDYANARVTFVSKPMFDEMLKPYYARLCNVAREADLPIEFHVCGKAETTIDDMTAMGVNSWQVAQPFNDLKGLREKYGTRLMFNGGWDMNSMKELEITEANVRQSVRDYIDTLGKDGGLAFFDFIFQLIDPEIAQWVADEVVTYGHKIYQ